MYAKIMPPENHMTTNIEYHMIVIQYIVLFNSYGDKNVQLKSVLSLSDRTTYRF